jgi:membrane-bound lytic murein transglycosylase D
MQHQIRWPSAAPLVLVLAAAGCGPQRAALPPAAPPASVATATAQPAPPPPPPVDPVAILLAEADRHLAAGEAELQRGHLNGARTEFDRAIDLLIESPYGARVDPRIRDHFDRLVARISALELSALSVGDGFTEAASEPAPIDELLATSVLDAATPPTAEVERIVRADLEATAHDIPIPLNERVLAYVELFQGRLRDWVQTGLTRAGRYLPMIQGVFRAEGLPLDLAYVPLIESAFKPNALSRAKAKGVWQFMRSTGRENGLEQNWFIDERADPEKSTRAAAQYLRRLHGMFAGDWHLALASYNGGPGRVQRALKRSGASDFWEVSRSRKFLPRETREYVPMILAAIIIARNPAQYGFDVPPVEPVAYERVTLTRPMDLRRVAEWAGVELSDIQALNPELRRWTTPLGTATYEVKVPVGTGARLQDQLSTATDTEFATLRFHRTRRGDTLASVARRYGVARADLAGANDLSVKARLRPGQQLLIPRAPAALLASGAAPPATPPVLASRELDTDAAATRTAERTERDDLVRTTYRVRRGDTLSSIARLFQTNVPSLKRWNGLSGSNIKPGLRLTIYQPRKS